MNPEVSPETVNSHEDQQPPQTWKLWRQDIHGSQYMMLPEYNSEEEALNAQELYTKKGHHQTYWVALFNPNGPTFIPANE